MNLGQTLSFAAATRLTTSDRKSEAFSVARDVSSTFHLDSAFDTNIGNAIEGITTLFLYLYPLSDGQSMLDDGYILMLSRKRQETKWSL